MNPISLGFLTPYSSIYPHFFSHLTAGFYLGLDQDPRRKTDIQLVPEFAGSGGTSGLMEAAKKLLYMGNVDILSGMISYRSLPELIPLIDSRQSLGFFFDLGELIPTLGYHSPNIFCNSHQLYQSQYALGYWAQKEFKNPGHIIMPIYNSGFNLNSAFQAGIGAAGGSTLLQSIIDYRPGDAHHLDIEPILEQVRRESPAFVHALFVGPQGNEFLELWKAQSWTSEIPLLVAENMLYDDMLGDVQHLGLELYGATNWNAYSEDKHNQTFAKKFRSGTGQPPNLYGLLGYEAGLLFKEILTPLRKRHWDVVKERMSNLEIETPRGIKNFTFMGGVVKPQIDIVKVKTNHESMRKLVIDQGEVVDLNSPVTSLIRSEEDSGWLNPYLCI